MTSTSEPAVPTATASSRYNVGVLHKALDVLDVVVASAPVALPEVAKGAGISISSAYRILGTLETRGIVRRDGRGGDVTVGPALLALCRAALASSDLLSSVRSVMQRLHDSCGETVNFAVLAGSSIRYVEMIERRRGLRTTVNVGSIDHLHSTALGRAILAALPSAEARELLRRSERVRVTENTRTTLTKLMDSLVEIRSLGYAVDDEENELGVRCIGAAIYGEGSRPVGALSISGPTSRMRTEVIARLGLQLRKEVAEIHYSMGVRDD